jgi:hypothetical protein
MLGEGNRSSSSTTPAKGIEKINGGKLNDESLKGG